MYNTFYVSKVVISTKTNHTHRHTHPHPQRGGPQLLLHFVLIDGNQSQVSQCPIVCWKVFVRASVAQTFSSVSLTLNWSVQTSCNKTHSSSHTTQHTHKNTRTQKGGSGESVNATTRKSSSLFLLCADETEMIVKAPETEVAF